MRHLMFSRWWPRRCDAV